MKKIIVLLMISFHMPMEIYSQAQKQFSIGQTMEIESKLLNRIENVQLYLPENYEHDAEKKYPIIFLFDGEKLFHSVTGIIKSLAAAKKIPESIVVGVNPERSFCYVKDRIELYLNHIDKELLPYIESRFRSLDYRMVIAGSLNGQVGFYDLVLNKGLFQVYVLSSPFFTISDCLYDTEHFLNKQSSLNKYLFLSAGFEHEQKVDKIFKLARLLNRAPVEGFFWAYQSYEERSMEIMLMNSIIDCLPQVFADLQIPQIATGVDLEAKFRDRGKLLDKYGYDILNITSSPKSVSREILNLILQNQEISQATLSNFSNDPYFFADEVEYGNLVNYLFSIGRRQEATMLRKFVGKASNSSALNNYSSNIELSRGLVVHLTFEKGQDENNDLGKVEFTHAIHTKGINEEKNSAIEFTDKTGAVKMKYDSLINPSRSITISCWINPRTLNPVDSWAMSCKQGNLGPHWNTTVGMYPDQWGFEVYSIGRVVYLVRDPIPLNVWTHIAIVADQSIGQLVIYKNGEKILARNDLVPFANSTEYLQIGNDFHAFDGCIDEFMLYQRVLSEAEIKELYKQKID